MGINNLSCVIFYGVYEMNEIARQTMNSAINANDDNENKYLTFLLGSETYAFSILKVSEIIEYGEITPMPMMPDFICGAINLRGSAVPVIDLSLRMGKEAADITRRTCIVIVELQNEEAVINIGVIIDSVSKVLDLRADEIEPAPSFGGNIRTDFIEGMGKLDNEFIIVLNLDEIISMDDMHSLSHVQEIADEG